MILRYGEPLLCENLDLSPICGKAWLNLTFGSSLFELWINTTMQMVSGDCSMSDHCSSVLSRGIVLLLPCDCLGESELAITLRSLIVSSLIYRLRSSVYVISNDRSDAHMASKVLPELFKIDWLIRSLSSKVKEFAQIEEVMTLSMLNLSINHSCK
jgi:hypothetical protein